MGFKTIEAQISDVLNEYSHLDEKVVERASKKAADSAVQKLKNTSPKRTGKYASGWTSKKAGHGYIVFNRAKPSLTHLLEFGHLIENNRGTYGRAPAIKHIAPVGAEAAKEFEENVRKELSK